MRFVFKATLRKNIFKQQSVSLVLDYMYKPVIQRLFQLKYFPVCSLLLTILQGHHRSVQGVALPKSTAIGFKICKHAREFFSL